MICPVQEIVSKSGGNVHRRLSRLLCSFAASLLCTLAHAAVAPFTLQVLDDSAVSAAQVLSGAFDTQFKPYRDDDKQRRTTPFWLKVSAREAFASDGVPVLIVHKGRHLDLLLFAEQGGQFTPLAEATQIPQFRAAHDVVFVMPQGWPSGETLYARIAPRDTGSQRVEFSAATLERTLAIGKSHARMIAIAFGALTTMALAVLLAWFVLSDRMFIHYALLIATQALYVVYFSGQGFDWPVFSLALPLSSYMWNVPAALSGAIASLFVREIADLKLFSPRVHKIFGWLAVVFVLLAVANVAEEIGLGGIVAAIGNLVFVGAAIFTLVVAFLAWRRGNNAAGWFLVAWGLLEVCTIVTAVSFLFMDAEQADNLLFFGLPLSMVVAAILLALGIADRLREQRRALTEAQRHAQVDPLTGVLNRRSLLERLAAASLRAQNGGLSVALLFIDLDHFKKINDTYGHLAGDLCLKAIVAPIQAELRQTDVVGRYGGEEFVVILSSADEAAAHPIAERIRNRVAEISVEGFGKPIRLTCSIGVAASDTLGVWGEHLIAHADHAAYAAKKFGRNRVELAPPRAA